MNVPVVPPNPRPRPLTILAGGCLIALSLSFCIGAIFFGRWQWTIQNAPTPTVTMTPVPQPLVHVPADPKQVVHEDFSSNENDWGLYYGGKLEVINGKLVLQSGIQNGIGVGTSNQIAPASEHYYVQADFFTDIDTDLSYGLVFGFNPSLSTYYLFEIFSQSSAFRLFKANAGQWTELIPFTRASVRPYPHVNTLSVYFNKGAMELYINGELVSEYTDEDFLHSKDVGMYVDDIGYRLLVDDLFVYDVK